MKMATAKKREKTERFFTVGHGPDNFEEVIDLAEIVFVRCVFEYHSDPCYLNGKWEEGHWNYIASLTFRNGRTEKIHLSEKGYRDLIKNWIQCK